jgi:signal transduction histidine kinase
MKAHAVAQREALRIFRLLLVVQLVFIGLSSLAALTLGRPFGAGIILRSLPTLLLIVLFLPPWLEPVLGRWYLAIGLGLEVLLSSFETALLFFSQPTTQWEALGLPQDLAWQLSEAPPIEPFFFLLIPLVLLAWGYGRRGAIWGAAWAAALHLGIGFWVSFHSGFQRYFLLQTLGRIVLLFLVPFIVGALAERERQRTTQLENTYQRLRTHTTTVEQLAISRERIRLARDMHDTLAHSLSALAVQLEALRSVLTNNPKAAQETLDDLVDLARQGLHDSRQAIQSLRQDPVEALGIEGALRDMLQAFQARTGVEAVLGVAGQEPDLTDEEAQALYRVAEEAIINVEEHASANTVNVRLACGVDRIDLVVQDDGVGFDPSTVEPDRYGLIGMRERAAMVGADLEVVGRPGTGSEIWCTLHR